MSQRDAVAKISLVFCFASPVNDDEMYEYLDERGYPDGVPLVESYKKELARLSRENHGDLRVGDIELITVNLGGPTEQYVGLVATGMGAKRDYATFGLWREKTGTSVRQLNQASGKWEEPSDADFLLDADEIPREIDRGERPSPKSRKNWGSRSRVFVCY